MAPTNLVFVDCEAVGGCPRTGQLTEFGAVTFDGEHVFHGVVTSRNGAPPANGAEYTVARDFEVWLAARVKGKPVFVSDNPAYDWQWINDLFWRTLGQNPFGHSARRISDFYAGLTGNWGNTQQWKRLRVTPHDHNPVHDAQGNREAFHALLAGKR